MTGLRRTIDAPAVAKSGRQTGDEDMPVIAGAVALGVQGDFLHRIAAVERIENKENCRAMPTQQDEVDPFRRHGSPERQAAATGHLQV